MTEKHEIDITTFNSYLAALKGHPIQCYLLGEEEGPLAGILVGFDADAIFLDVTPEANGTWAIMRHAISYIVPIERLPPRIG